MVGIDEVARRAGVSTATVSRALSGRGTVSAATRARVLAAADELGYVVSAAASSLATGRTRNVGVLVPLLDRWFYAQVLSGIATRLSPEGYDLTLYNLPDAHAPRRDVLARSLRRNRVDAVIALSVFLDDEEVAELQRLGKPVIAIGRQSPQLVALTVDDRAVARLATAHLLELGHTAVAHIGESRGRHGEVHVPTLRRRGFEQAMTDAGIPVHGDLLEPADFTIDGGYRAAGRLLDRADRPTAIFAASDEMAFGAIFAARERGLRVPEDLSVVGVDGHEMSGFFALTTVDQFPHAQGERAAEAVLAVLRSGDAPEPASLAFELVVRNSTARPA
ncbi:LacI family transcriptional regulator [Microbacterium saccharophilum]|uniref:LacI family transcriptional regulator n=1 Tax=Microbacterium saccharophilum TaxID=1213358 RepID=A0A5C8I7L5_9MICO|nr:LacI family DNA-binding transcriptional regulator [Microbacterium saccharophilum]TXK15145.1 LacI family transcriptional regulator [Microbacterium saccharophilum]GEP47562.1 LacI family transcriptional regulator [Microbacterium saccharophilum]